MLYTLVMNHVRSISMLDRLDVVGVDYRNGGFLYTKLPDHFFGNFWWTRSDYVRKLSVYRFNKKYDPEWWIFTGTPVFFNIPKSWVDYQNSYKRDDYADIVDRNMDSISEIVANPRGYKILYGSDESNYLDVTEICYSLLFKDNVLTIPAGDHERNGIFTDPIVGTVKHILIGKMKTPYIEDVRIRVD